VKGETRKAVLNAVYLRLRKERGGGEKKEKRSIFDEVSGGGKKGEKEEGE